MVFFEVPPDIDDLQTSSDVIVNEGDDASLICKAKGHPRPKIVWLREDRKEFPVFERVHNSNHTRARAMGECLNVICRINRAYLCEKIDPLPCKSFRHFKAHVGGLRSPGAKGICQFFAAKA